MSASAQRPTVFIPGEPVLSGGRGQDEWQAAIGGAAPGPYRAPSLSFVVSGLRRRGNLFDLDNLVHPVLMVWPEPVDAVEARLFVGDAPGLWVHADGAGEPPADVERDIYLETHSMTSTRGRPVPDILARELALDEHDGIGVALDFDRDDIPIRRGWFGPTEAVVDDLVSWLGVYTRRELIADHRIRHLIFRRGVDPGRTGVRIRAWYVPDDVVLRQPTHA